MNILFIFSQKDSLSGDQPLTAFTSMQMGISFISSVLKLNGHQTSLLVLSKNNQNILDKKIRDFAPALIGFTAVFSEYRFICKIAGYVKEKYPEIFLLVGGPHVSLNPESCLSDPFDAFCIGEGEEATVELADQLQHHRLPGGIRNLWIKRNGDIERNPTRSFIQDLDALPFPDRGIWLDWISDRHSAVPVMLGRGCPFQCTYCCNHALKRLAAGEYVRIRSVANILREVEMIVTEQPVRTIYFEIETFGVNIHWSLDLCKGLEEFNRHLTKPISFGVNFRISPKLRLEELFPAMRRANFEFINIGLESGNETIRRQVLNRNYSNAFFLSAVRYAKKIGLKVSLFIMIGIPGETLEAFNDTIKITRASQPDYYELFIFFPYPGTALHRLCRDKDIIPEHFSEEKERSRPVLNLEGFSNREIVSNYVWFDYYVNKGIKPLTSILANVARNWIYASPQLFRFIRKILSNRLVFHFLFRLKYFFIGSKTSV